MIIWSKSDIIETIKWIWNLKPLIFVDQDFLSLLLDLSYKHSWIFVKDSNDNHVHDSFRILKTLACNRK